jgi:4-hydroxyacetophenone monooxygenase
MTDEELRTALAEAHLPSLLPALGLLDGDWAAVRALVPGRLRVVDEQGGLDAGAQQAVRDHAFAVLRRHRDGELGAPRTDRAAVEEGLALVLGEDAAAYGPMAREELAIDDADPRAPGWRAPARAETGVLDAIIVGAGLSGLLAAHRLAQAGVRFTVLERHPDLGGTWFANRYPGCRVDVPSHLYAYSCLGDEDWAHTFATREEVHASFRRFAAGNDLLGHVRCGHEVLAARYDEDTALWAVDVLGPDGECTLRTRLLVSAVGQLGRPSVPDLPGRDTFAGRQFHSAEWDDGADLAGRRYGVVGTGASAIQVITGLLAAGADVTVFQRTPAWLFPTPELRAPVGPGLRRLLREVPTYARWYRLWLHRSVSDGLLPFAECDPAWEDPRAVSAVNDSVRKALTAYLRQQFGEDPDLLAAMVPAYPPFAKRVIRDDGSYAQAFLRDGARLVTAAIEALRPEGITTADGELHPLDGIVYATGFHASEFLVPMRVTGRGGRDLHAQWGPDATAHLGMAVPGFPDLFLLYGPNTNIVVNGSVTFFTECQLRLLLDAARRIVVDGEVLEVREDVHDAFVAEIDAQNRRRAWGCAGVDNWYLSPTGRVSQNWPGTALEYWERTAAIDPSEFHITTAREDIHA